MTVSELIDILSRRAPGARVVYPLGNSLVDVVVVSETHEDADGLYVELDSETHGLNIYRSR